MKAIEEAKKLGAKAEDIIFVDEEDEDLGETTSSAVEGKVGTGEMTTASSTGKRKKIRIPRRHWRVSRFWFENR